MVTIGEPAFYDKNTHHLAAGIFIKLMRWNMVRHQMETFSALLAICAGNWPVPGDFPAQRPVTRNIDVFFDLRPSKLLSTQSWGWWFETPPRPLWRPCNENGAYNSLRPRQNGYHFPDDVFKCISLNGSVRISLKVSLNMMIKLTICQHWWR